MNKLNIIGLSHSYGDFEILHSLNLSFRDGISVVLGENGAGKSTLLSLIATLFPLQSGNIYLNETLYSANNLSLIRSHIGYLPQFPSFPGNFRVQECLEYQLWLQRVPRATWKSNINKATELTFTTTHLDTKLTQLSGGTQRRVFIAQAIVHNPQLIILDEPASGLDPLQQEHLNETLTRISRNRIVILSTHSLDQASQLAENLILLHEGNATQRSYADNEKPSLDELRRSLIEGHLS